MPGFLPSRCYAMAELDGTLVSCLPLPSIHCTQGLLLSLSSFSASAGMKLAQGLNIQALKHKESCSPRGEGSACWNCGNCSLESSLPGPWTLGSLPTRGWVLGKKTPRRGLSLAHHLALSVGGSWAELKVTAMQPAPGSGEL